MMKCACHTGYIMHESSKGEIRGRNRHQSNSKKVEILKKGMRKISNEA